MCCRHARIRTRADSHDGRTHVIRLKVDRKNTSLRKRKSLRSEDPTDQESEILKLFSISFNYAKVIICTRKFTYISTSVLNYYYDYRLLGIAYYYVNCYVNLLTVIEISLFDFDDYD